MLRTGKSCMELGVWQILIPQHSGWRYSYYGSIRVGRGTLGSGSMSRRGATILLRRTPLEVSRGTLVLYMRGMSKLARAGQMCGQWPAVYTLAVPIKGVGVLEVAPVLRGDLSPTRSTYTTFSHSSSVSFSQLSLSLSSAHRLCVCLHLSHFFDTERYSFGDPSLSALSSSVFLSLAEDESCLGDCVCPAAGWVWRSFFASSSSVSHSDSGMFDSTVSTL